MPRKTIRVKPTFSPSYCALKPSSSKLTAECAALKKENAKLHKRIVKLEVQNISANNRVFALEERFKEIEHLRTPSLPDVKSLDNLAATLAQTLVDPKVADFTERTHPISTKGPT